MQAHRQWRAVSGCGIAAVTAPIHVPREWALRYFVQKKVQTVIGAYAIIIRRQSSHAKGNAAPEERRLVQLLVLQKLRHRTCDRANCQVAHDLNLFGGRNSAPDRPAHGPGFVAELFSS